MVVAEMARKNVDLTFLRGKEVEVISDDDDDDDEDDDDSSSNDDEEETLRKYSKPVSVYKTFANRAKDRPLFLRRCLKYIIRAKKEKTSNSGREIIFNYMDRRKQIVKVEVVRKFSCPFCLMRCGSQGGLQDHLEATHDVFNFEFFEEEDHEVDVTLKYDYNSSGEEFHNDPNKIPYYFCSRRRRMRNQRKSRNKIKKLNVRFLDLELNDLNELPSDAENESNHMNDDNVSSPPKAHSLEEAREIPTTTPPLPTIAQSPEPVPTIITQTPEPVPTIAQTPEPVPTIAQTPESVPAIAQSSEPLLPRAKSSKPRPAKAQSSKPKVPRTSKRKKILAERLKTKREDGLKSQQFYHSQSKQPMTLEEVMSNVDSENEEDDYSADIIERMRLLQIKDVSKEEKQFMHLWNIFIRKQRVVADRYVPLACEEFTKLHKQELQSSSKSFNSTSFFWWWTLFKIKLWNHGLISGNTINKCSIILQNSDVAGPSTSHGNILQNSDEAGPSTSHGNILQNSDVAGPSTSHGNILRNSDEAGPSTSHGVIHRNSDEAGPSTSHGVILRNTDEAGPSTSHGTANANTEEWMEVDE